MEVNIMKVDRFTKGILCIIAVLLVLNLAHGFFASKPALAVHGSEDIVRYRISAWAAQAGVPSIIVAIMSSTQPRER
jgi:hypothetical protein